MRIGIDCRLWSESGVGRYTRNLVQELLVLDDDHVYVLFVLLRDEENVKTVASKIKNRNVKIVIADVRWHSIAEQIKFPKILFTEKLDVMHFPYFSLPIVYPKPFVVTIHDLIIHHFPTGQASTLPLPIYLAKVFGYKSVIQIAALRAKHILTVSHATKKEIVDHLKIHNQKITVITEGSSMNPTEKSMDSPVKNKKYFLYVGNAYPHKNLERLLRAFKSVVTNRGAVYLVMVGKKDYFYNRILEKVNQMGLTDNVIFVYSATDEELSSFYKNALALVMPSFMEGFGLPVLEAMSQKCPILVSDIPAFRELCHDTAYYFNPYDISEIQSRMEKTLTQEISRSRRQVLQAVERSKSYSWKKMAVETRKVYEEVARGSSS